MIQNDIVECHPGAVVGFTFTPRGPAWALVRAECGPPIGVGCGREVACAVYIREGYARPSEDSGPGALLLVSAPDEWRRLSPDEEQRWLRDRPPYGWRGRVL